ncbi:MAG TPA: efflux RND transporter periplasmic adaptor subunit [Vicinamibacterales bacterium]|nr:efflux RND transporter periplasmic adaptor subunit [Vicinamibacterales bacterium]
MKETFAAFVAAASSAATILAQGGATTPAANARPVNVTTVVARSLDRPLAVPGDLVAYQDVEIRAKVPGFVEVVNVDRGSTVRRGQLLARLVAPELGSQRSEAAARVQSAVSQRIEAEAKLASDEATFQRLKTAAATPGVVAGNDVDVAQRTVEADRARVEQWKQNEEAAREGAKGVQELEGYLRITAPFDGVVTDRNVHVGSLVGPTSEPMLRVQQVSRLRLIVNVPESAVGSVQSGAMMSFTVPAFPGEMFAGKVARIGRALDPKTRTMPVELDVANSTGRLAPGMFAQVSWTMRRSRGSLFVPPTAIATTTERTFVVRVRDNTAEWVDVKRGDAMDQLVEVFGALKEGDVVAVRGTDEIRQGTRVTPTMPPRPAAQ